MCAWNFFDAAFEIIAIKICMQLVQLAREITWWVDCSSGNNRNENLKRQLSYY